MRADTVTKDFISDTAVFADVFNYYVYKGEQVISPERLTEQNSTKIALPYGEDGAVVPIQKFRDVQKLCTSMSDGKVEYVLYGVENQSEIHYAMAVKNILYDALDYAGQVEEAARTHRRAMKKAKEHLNRTAKKHPNSGEFLSGFWKEDRLVPSVTVTIYFGYEEWDGALSLLDMMDVDDPRVLMCMDNYHVRLIAPAHMTDDEIGKFHSSLREVLLFIKHSKDKDSLEQVLKRNEERFRDLERRAADVIQVITHTDLKYGRTGEGRVNVCQAIQEMKEEAQLKGEKIGAARGEKIGVARGEKIGERTINELMKRLIQDGRMEDLKRSIYDGDYKEQLLREYGIRELIGVQNEGRSTT